ncbi:MAG TPA: NUDIX hydrolase, partial [Nitrolancea sp.]|nr:NUDIX hydrolase [Nitrolancea sp.]
FSGRLIRVRVDTVRMPDGSLHEREIVEHPGAVAIVPVLPNGELVMVRQYRHAVRKRTLELPAGTREAGEAPYDTAMRELREETGHSAGSLNELVRFSVSPGWTNEELIVYLARDLTEGPAATEADEDLSLETIAPDTVADLIKRGEISDSKSIIGLLAWLGIRLPYDQSTNA